MNLDDYLSRHNLLLHGFTADGKLVRFDRAGKKSGWMVAHDNGDGVVLCWGDWKTGEEGKFSNIKDEKKTQKLLKSAQNEAEKEKSLLQMQAANLAEKIWEYGRGDLVAPYCRRKEIGLNGAKTSFCETGVSVLVPMKDGTGKLWGMQEIYPDGTKKFLFGQRITGTFYTVGDITRTIYVCEGFATACSIHEATEQAAVCAFNASNITHVAKAIKEAYKTANIVVCGDDDQFTTLPSGEKRNVGRLKAGEAAISIGTKAVFPQFKTLHGEPTDFNDLVLREGAETLRKQLQSGIPPFQIDLIPEQLREYVEQGHKMINCPLSYIAIPTIASVCAAIGPTIRGQPLGTPFYPPTYAWTMGIGEKGTAKSSAQNYGTRMLRRIDINLEAKFRKIMKDNKPRLTDLHERYKATKKKVGKDEDAIADLEEIEAEIERLTPQRYHWLVTDFTTASAIDLLQTAQKGLCAVYDELSFLFQMFRKEHATDLRNLALMGWNGDETFKKKLKGETDYSILRDYALNIIGMIQPSMFQSIFSGKRSVDDGFLERFQMVFYPDKVPPKRRTIMKETPRITTDAECLFHDLFHANPTDLGEAVPGRSFYSVEFEHDAQQFYLDFDLESQEKAHHESDTYMQGYHSKSPRTLTALATAFYSMDRIRNNGDKKVQLAHVQLAKRWIDFLAINARHVFNLI